MAPTYSDVHRVEWTKGFSRQPEHQKLTVKYGDVGTDLQKFSLFRGFGPSTCF